MSKYENPHEGTKINKILLSVQHSTGGDKEAVIRSGRVSVQDVMMVFMVLTVIMIILMLVVEHRRKAAARVTQYNE